MVRCVIPGELGETRDLPSLLWFDGDPGSALPSGMTSLEMAQAPAAPPCVMVGLERAIEAETDRLVAESRARGEGLPAPR